MSVGVQNTLLMLLLLYLQRIKRKSVVNPFICLSIGSEDFVFVIYFYFIFKQSIYKYSQRFLSFCNEFP